ncbi:hypothetical protein DFJ58DRAFT_840200 [Suillus subalutaceus]|uniref:uncharacterized protein n=1 Tax=Suillus subalutaceus TaxID=48586 RepID=UPI001B87175A|nr:uncharacterized protein DFJ58DRAFT_840200 [Suillus subalutaceus]KAG1859334.1 hypothetical protein DFJ58DRAFT_840200 [Suillus subalutaceus]
MASISLRYSHVSHSSSIGVVDEAAVSDVSLDGACSPSMAPSHSPWTWTSLYFGSNAFNIHEVDWRLQVALDYANWRIHLSFDNDALDPVFAPNAGALALATCVKEAHWLVQILYTSFVLFHWDLELQTL